MRCDRAQHVTKEMRPRDGLPSSNGLVPVPLFAQTVLHLDHPQECLATQRTREHLHHRVLREDFDHITGSCAVSGHRC